MLQVSLNSGKTFVSSNVNITAKNCTKMENSTKTENGTEKENETESGGETKQEVRKLASVDDLYILIACLLGKVLIL